MRLCCNCFEGLLDRETVCPICNNTITLNNDQTKEFYQLVDVVRKANKIKRKIYMKDSKYELLFKYIQYREEHPKENINYGCPKILRVSHRENYYESEAEYWERINKHTINKDELNQAMVECPYCKSTNTKKIAISSKAIHTAMFGALAISRNSKQWNCNNCNSDF